MTLKRAHRLLAAASWTTVLLIILGYVDSIAAVDQWLTAAEAHPIVRWGVVALLLMAAATVLLVWWAAVWYAILDPAQHRIPRPMVIGLLVIGGFAAGLAYYFFVVHRRPPVGEARGQVKIRV